MRATTAAEATLRAICRHLRAHGARMSIVAATGTNGLAVGSWPDVCEQIGLVLVGDEGRI